MLFCSMAFWKNIFEIVQADSDVSSNDFIIFRNKSTPTLRKISVKIRSFTCRFVSCMNFFGPKTSSMSLKACCIFQSPEKTMDVKFGT